LHTAARVLLRLSLLPPTSTELTPSFASVVEAVLAKLRAAEPSLGRVTGPSQDATSAVLWSAKDILRPISLTAEQAWSDVVENLWRVVLSLGPDVARGGVPTETMEALSGRVAVGGGGEGSSIGRWVQHALKAVLGAESAL
jgi:hypothetical protein